MALPPGWIAPRRHKMSTSTRRPLRFVTYLAPGIPRAFFELVAARVAAELDTTAHLTVDASSSGPTPTGPDPFSSGDADVGFLCAPTYRWLRARSVPPVELVPAAPTFDDPRAAARPVYFSDVVVRRESRLDAFSSLRGGVWAYNDACSLSGYHSLTSRLGPGDSSISYFRALLASGSHAASMRLVAAGVADAAAIDSNVLALAARAEPELLRRLRVLDTWGPFPIQPVVVRSGLDDELKPRIARALLALEGDGVARRSLSHFGARGFVPVADADYAEVSLRGAAT